MSTLELQAVLAVQWFFLMLEYLRMLNCLRAAGDRRVRRTRIDDDRWFVDEPVRTLVLDTLQKRSGACWN
jgi:hypothetical protein